jgi:hypothetical protein
VLKALALTGAAVLMLSGCTQKSTSSSDDPVVSAPASSTVAPSSPEATSDPAGSTSASASTSPPSSSVPPPTKTTPAPTPKPTIERGGCPTSALTVRALRGSGAAGHQFAFLQFTNNSTTACTLTGYPGVQLLLGGKPLGQPAQRSGKPISTVTIAPGTSVSAGIVDDSSCNAAESDSVQVFPPNRTDRLVLKLAIRGCALQVDPVAAS